MSEVKRYRAPWWPVEFVAATDYDALSTQYQVLLAQAHQLRAALLAFYDRRTDDNYKLARAALALELPPMEVKP
jgi:hypothetical protein